MKDKYYYFNKMLDYINRIAKSIKGISYDDFMQDDDKQAACSFNISQIAENANKITDSDKKHHKDLPWIEIKALRNRIVHDYDSINKKILWDTIKTELPKLAKDIKDII